MNSTQSEDLPLVSVITITYNAEAYLEETILSVIGQTYPKIEYIIIDGASQDNTLQIIQKYELRISHWQSEPDKGIYDAMNKGLALAQGEYVWFMNAGDAVEAPDTLEKVLKISSSASIYYGEAAYYDLENNYLGLRSEVMPHHLPKNLRWQDFDKGMVVCHQAVIVKKQITEPYDLNHRFSADIDWLIKALKKADNVQNTGLVLAKYKQGGFSRKYLLKSLWDRAVILKRHFGWRITLLNHLRIAGRAIGFILKRGKTY